MINSSKSQQQNAFPTSNGVGIDQSFEKEQIASSDIGLDLWLLEIPVKLVILVVTAAITLGKWAGEKVGEGIDWLRGSVEDFIQNNPSEGDLRQIAGGLRDIQRELTQRGLPGAREVQSIEELIREPLKAKQRERGEDRNPANDRKLTDGEIEALEEGGVDIHDLKDDVPGGASKGDLYKDRNGDIYVKPKGGRGYGMETGLNINDFSQYLSSSPSRNEDLTLTALHPGGVNIENAAHLFLETFNQDKGNLEEKMAAAVYKTMDQNPELSDDVLKLFVTAALDEYNNQASHLEYQHEA